MIGSSLVEMQARAFVQGVNPEEAEVLGGEGGRLVANGDRHLASRQSGRANAGGQQLDLRGAECDGTGKPADGGLDARARSVAGRDPRFATRHLDLSLDDGPGTFGVGNEDALAPGKVGSQLLDELARVDCGEIRLAVGRVQCGQGLVDGGETNRAAERTAARFEQRGRGARCGQQDPLVEGELAHRVSPAMQIRRLGRIQGRRDPR